MVQYSVYYNCNTLCLFARVVERQRSLGRQQKRLFFNGESRFHFKLFSCLVAFLPKRKKNHSLILLQLGMNFEAVRSECSILHVFPFNSLKKRGGVAVQLVM